MMKTITVVMMVSRRVGQVTLLVSSRTSCKNLNGLAIASFRSTAFRRTQNNKSNSLPQAQIGTRCPTFKEQTDKVLVLGEVRRGSPSPGRKRWVLLGPAGNKIKPGKGAQDAVFAAFGSPPKRTARRRMAGVV